MIPIKLFLKRPIQITQTEAIKSGIAFQRKQNNVLKCRRALSMLYFELCGGGGGRLRVKEDLRQIELCGLRLPWPKDIKTSHP